MIPLSESRGCANISNDQQAQSNQASAPLDDHTEEVEVRTLVHLSYRFVPLALDQQLAPRAAWTVLGGAYPIAPK